MNQLVANINNIMGEHHQGLSEEEQRNLKLGDFIWKNFVGKRLLVTEWGVPKSETYEYTVREVSPTGLRVKFENGAGRTFWTDHKQYYPVEVLP
jgi:hypothetical protein